MILKKGNAMGFRVPYIDLGSQFRTYEEEIMSEVRRVMTYGSFILREDVNKLESELASFLGVKFAVGVNSGTDALFLALKTVGIGQDDEVITVAHTFVASIAAIIHCGAMPVLVDIRDDFNMDVTKIKAALTSKTKAIVPVHMNGRACEMDIILDIAHTHNLVVIEDAAQAIGARYNNKSVGSFGKMGCFSLHPMKSLSAAGDGGFVTTDDTELAEKIKILRNHGQKIKNEFTCFGYNSRLDNLQAAIVRIKLKYLTGWIERRRELASRYEENFLDIKEIQLPPGLGQRSAFYDAFNSYVIRTQYRDELKNYLETKGIEAFSSWFPPVHHHKGLELSYLKLPVTERISKEVISLPIYPELSDSDQQFVIEAIRGFFGK